MSDGLRSNPSSSHGTQGVYPSGSIIKFQSVNMTMTPHFYESIDRNAILVRPKMPYDDWATQVSTDTHVRTGLEGHNMYLIREMDNNAEVKKWI